MGTDNKPCRLNNDFAMLQHCLVRRVFDFFFTLHVHVGGKGLGSLTINFCPADMEKNILQRVSKYYNGYKI